MVYLCSFVCLFVFETKTGWGAGGGRVSGCCSLFLLFVFASSFVCSFVCLFWVSSKINK